MKTAAFKPNTIKKPPESKNSSYHITKPGWLSKGSNSTSYLLIHNQGITYKALELMLKKIMFMRIKSFEENRKQA